MELDCDQKLYRDTAVNGAAPIGGRLAGGRW